MANARVLANGHPDGISAFIHSLPLLPLTLPTPGLAVQDIEALPSRSTDSLTETPPGLILPASQVWVLTSLNGLYWFGPPACGGRGPERLSNFFGLL